MRGVLIPVIGFLVIFISLALPVAAVIAIIKFYRILEDIEKDLQKIAVNTDPKGKKPVGYHF